MARSSFIGHRPGMRPDDQSDLDLPAEAAEDQFDAVAVVHWIDGSAAVTRLFVNP